MWLRRSEQATRRTEEVPGQQSATSIEKSESHPRESLKAPCPKLGSGAHPAAIYLRRCSGNSQPKQGGTDEPIPASEARPQSQELLLTVQNSRIVAASLAISPPPKSAATSKIKRLIAA